MFKPVACGETLPQGNIHAVSVSIPTFRDIISYEEGINSEIKRGYPRFVLHPYLQKIAIFLEEKYGLKKNQEVVLVSSSKFARLICDRYKIKSKIDFKEEFGVILVEKNSPDLENVLSFIQHVGCNLSSRYAEDFLFKNRLIKSLHVEEIVEKEDAKNIIISTLSSGYNQPKQNISLSVSGMNAIYAVLKGLQDKRSERDTIVQLGWLYLDCMNIVKNYSKKAKIFYDVKNLEALEEYLKIEGQRVTAIITEVPTNPLLQNVDLRHLKSLCEKHDIALVIDATFATPYNINLKPYADIMIESLTKFACGNADILMGCFVVNENSKYSYEDFSQYTDEPYIKDMQRLAFEIQGYGSRMKKINSNSKKLIEYLKTKKFVKKIYFSSFCGVISLTFTKSFEKVYDTLDFHKGPSLGTEFTLVMPYVYLAHYDLITCKDGRELLKDNDIPIDLLRVSVGMENIEAIKKEFDKLDYI